MILPVNAVALNKVAMKQGLMHIFLHARSIVFAHPLTGEGVCSTAPLPKESESFIVKLDAGVSLERSSTRE